MKTLDWSRPENLRFRNVPGKIIEALVPTNKRILDEEPYPVTVYFENIHNMVEYAAYDLDGTYMRVQKGKDPRDIIEINETTENDGQIT